MNIYILLGILFLITFVFGHVLEKFRIPWIFSALAFGVILSFNNPFAQITQSSEFLFMSEIGLYLLLFLIGFELDIRNIRKSGKFIVKATFAVEIAEMLLVGTLLHFLFSLSWPLAFLLALSFATVGEAILLPMLEEFKMVKSKLGQRILGVATFDNIFELFALFAIVFAAPFFIGGGVDKELQDPLLIQALVLLGGLLLIILFSVKKLKKEVTMMNIPNVAAILPLLLAVFFIFLGIDNSESGDVAVLGALFAGIIAKSLLPPHFLSEVEPQIKTITFGLFAPVFFLHVGLDTNGAYLVSQLGIIILITLIANIAKIGAAYLVGRKELGAKPSIFMGVALGVRFSTSIVFLQILLNNDLITTNLYSIMLGTSIVFKFVVPVVLAMLVKKWHLDKKDHAS